MMCTGTVVALARPRSNKGETLVETLAAILVGSLAMLMLANAIGTATNIILKANGAANAYHNAESSLASEMKDVGTVGLSGIEIEGHTYGNPKSINVKWKSESVAGGDTIVSYKLSDGVTP